MRKVSALLALLASVVSSAQAQQAWQAEIGIQGGYTQTKPAGTGVDDANSFIMLPGAGTIVPLLSYGSLYAIIPWKDKLAVEPTFGFAQLQAAGAQTAARLGLRLNYAFSPKLYGAAGGVLNYNESGGASGTQLGLQLGVGYRLRLTPTLNGRIEAQWVSTQTAEDVTPAFNAYSLLVGVSTRIAGRAAAPRRAASASLWSQAIGINAGYSRVHTVGGGFDGTFVTFPGIGGSLGSLGATAVAPATLFAIFPIGRKTALEPSFDVTSVDQGGASSTAITAGLRLNYAVSGGWYGAVGGQLWSVSDGTSASVFGGSVAWGHRFRLAGNLGGRVELNYLMLPQNDDIGAAINTFSILFGATMPLK